MNIFISACVLSSHNKVILPFGCIATRRKPSQKLSNVSKSTVSMMFISIDVIASVNPSLSMVIDKISDLLSN